MNDHTGDVKMSKRKDLINELKKAGLNQYESKAYLSLLLKEKPLSASEVGEEADIPRPRTYDVLRDLEKKGMVTQQPSRPIKYSALPVKESIDNLKRIEIKEHEERIEEIEKVKQTLQEEVEQITPRKERSNNLLWLLNDHLKIESKIKSLMENAQEEVVIATDPNDMKDNLVKYSEALKQAKDRGVKIKLFTHKDHGIPSEHEFMEVKEKEHGHRFMAIDDHSILFLTPREEEGEVGAWVKSPFLTKSLKRNLE